MYHIMYVRNSIGGGRDNNVKDVESRGCFLLILATYVAYIHTHTYTEYVHASSTLFLLTVSSYPV